VVDIKLKVDVVTAGCEGVGQHQEPKEVLFSRRWKEENPRHRATARALQAESRSSIISDKLMKDGQADGYFQERARILFPPESQ